MEYHNKRNNFFIKKYFNQKNSQPNIANEAINARCKSATQLRQVAVFEDA